ncbi:MAG: Hsp20/alpha crystallin family protein [Chloroflexi bacterium]|nr:Hsp20/alpha crystallin family protein [Chloroflexota bacterium]
MSDLIRFDPWNDLRSLRRMGRFFGENAVTNLHDTADTALDMYETEHAVVIKLAIPGFKPEDVEVTKTGDSLTIKGEMKQESGEQDEKRNYLWREIRRGAFQRVVTLPAGKHSEDITAEYENGVLVLTVPKSEAARPKTIQVKTKAAEGKE